MEKFIRLFHQESDVQQSVCAIYCWAMYVREGAFYLGDTLVAGGGPCWETCLRRGGFVGFSTDGHPASKSHWRQYPYNAFSLQSQLLVIGEFLSPVGQIFMHTNGDQNNSCCGISTVWFGVLVILSLPTNFWLGCINDPRSPELLLDI